MYVVRFVGCARVCDGVCGRDGWQSKVKRQIKAISEMNSTEDLAPQQRGPSKMLLKKEIFEMHALRILFDL